MIVPIFTAERALRTLLSRDLELLRREKFLPFGFGLCDFFNGHFWIGNFRNSLSRVKPKTGILEANFRAGFLAWHWRRFPVSNVLIHSV